MAKLSSEIETRRTRQQIAVGQRQLEDKAMTDVEERWMLPDTYGKTTVIDGDTAPLEIPGGPVEKLLNSMVPSMKLEDAGVRDVIKALADLEGLNIIADQALKEEAKLTINVRNVQLKELLSYIARNMGIAFHLGENVIWVTESTDPPGTGPKQETRVYPLRT